MNETFEEVDWFMGDDPATVRYRDCDQCGYSALAEASSPGFETSQRPFYRLADGTVLCGECVLEDVP